jgi:hypothetical protein
MPGVVDVVLVVMVEVVVVVVVTPDTVFDVTVFGVLTSFERSLVSSANTCFVPSSPFLTA